MSLVNVLEIRRRFFDHVTALKKNIQEKICVCSDYDNAMPCQNNKTLIINM
jgi:hypothetical protein